MKKKGLILFLMAITFFVCLNISTEWAYAALPEIKEITEDEYYGRNALSKMENAEKYLFIYDQLVEGLGKAETKIYVYDGNYPVTNKDLSNILEIVLNDYPQYFWIDNGYTYSYNSTSVLSISPYYQSTATNLEVSKEKFETGIDELIEGIDASMSEFERELIVHDRLAEKVVYDMGATNAHSAYGAIVDGKAVCDGYSRAFQYAMYKLGIQCQTVTGTSNGGGHAWNLIRVDGKYYYMDLTWDDKTESSQLYYGYFNLPLSEMDNDHTLEMFIELPECNSWDANYFTIFGGRIESPTVDMIVELMNDDLNARFYVVGDDSTIWAWFKENRTEIASKVGIKSGYSSGYRRMGKEWNIYFSNCTRTEIPVTSVSVNKDSYEFTHEGDSFTISATVLPVNAQNKKVYYSTSNKNVAIVNKYTGLVTCVGEGSADIIATSEDGAKTGVCKVSLKKYEDLKISANTDKNNSVVGENVTISAEATGGTGVYTYSYIVYNKTTNTWFRLADNIKESSYIWLASSEGNREFYVDVKDSEGNIIRSNVVNVITSNKNNLTVKGESNYSVVKLGTNVTLKATVSGEEETYTYSYIVYNKTTNTWFRLADNISSSSYIWNASSVGERIFYIDVKDSKGKVVRSNEINVNVVLESSLLIEGKSNDYDISVGETILISAESSGGAGKHTYSFLVYNEANGSWYRFSGFNSSNELSWTAGSKGSRIFYVEVKDEATGEIVRSEGIKVVVS